MRNWNCSGKWGFHLCVTRTRRWASNKYIIGQKFWARLYQNGVLRIRHSGLSQIMQSGLSHVFRSSSLIAICEPQRCFSETTFNTVLRGLIPDWLLIEFQIISIWNFDVWWWMYEYYLLSVSKNKNAFFSERPFRYFFCWKLCVKYLLFTPYDNSNLKFWWKVDEYMNII